MKNKIKNYLLKYLLNAILVEDVVTENSAKQVMIGGVVVAPDELRGLKTEAEYVLNSRVWSLLENTLKSQAQQVIFNKSTSFEDCTTGKLMLYNLDVQKRILKKLSTD